MTESEQKLFSDYSRFTGRSVTAADVALDPSKYIDDDSFIGAYAKSILTGDNLFTYGTFTDSRDGKTYKTVTVCGMTWLAENFGYVPSVCAKHITQSRARVFNTTNGRKECFYDPCCVRDVIPDGWHLPSLNDYWCFMDLFNVAMVLREEILGAEWYYCKSIILNSIFNLKLMGYFESPNPAMLYSSAKHRALTRCGKYMIHAPQNQIAECYEDVALVEITNEIAPSHASEETKLVCGHDIVKVGIKSISKTDTCRYNMRLVKD